MNTTVDISKLINGTIQGKQTPDALSPGHFALDERSTMQLLAYTVNIAAVLDYYNQAGEKDGEWDSLLMADVSVLSAWIAQYDNTKSYSRFLDFLKAIEDEDNGVTIHAFIYRFFDLGFDVIVKINEWYMLSNQNFATNTMTTYLLDSIRTKGSTLLEAFYEYYVALTESLPSFTNKIASVFATLDPIWSFNPFPDVKPIRLSDLKLAGILTDAARCGQQLFNLQTEINNAAKDIFQHALQRQDIPPHVGLMLTFLDLFRYQQDAMNALTGKHLDFYYHQVLRGVNAAAKPDMTFVTVQLAKGQTRVTIPKGTQLLAGKATNGQAVVFSTSGSSTITATQITQYRTLVFPDPQSSSLTDIYTSEVVDFNKPGNDMWPLFGGHVSTSTVAVSTTTLGFAFSCSDLLLSQGTRTVTITFTVEPGADLVSLTFSSFFELHLTATKGWYKAVLNPVTYSDNEICFSFTLSATDPAIVAYGETVHGKGFDGEWPVCKVLLTTHGKQAYSFIQTLSTSIVSIDTVVTGMFDFLVENDSGKLSPATPFIPFTDLGGNLYVGGQEFFVKKLNYLTLTIVWNTLPTSFENYYHAYNEYYDDQNQQTDTLKTPVFQNQVFKAKVYALAGDTWISVAGNSGNVSEYCLFTDEASNLFHEAPIVAKGTKVITINGPLPYNPDLPAYTRLDNSLQEGFFCITLSAPTKAFGAIDYPAIVSYVTLENSVAIIHNAKLIVLKKKKLKPVPNVPYVPKISGLEVTYSSSQQYSIDTSPDKLKWYYIHPFGIEPVVYQNASVSLFPLYKNSSYAYFGLDAIQVNTELSFFFTLANRIKSVDSSASSGFTYEYLSDNGWVELTVISDGTAGFQRTGIITFNIPDDMTANGIAVPGKLYWIRLGNTVGVNITTSFVSTQGVSVERELSSDLEYAPAEEGSITKLITPMPAIKSMFQPVRSFGGCTAQTENEFRKSAAGRLRYKKRAITVSDIEAIVLNEFAELFNVTAVPVGYLDSESVGLINVIVTPWSSPGAADCYRPFAAFDLMLRVLNFLLAHGLPSIQYKISNPDFYEVRVTCDVGFTLANREEEFNSRLNEDLKKFLSPWILNNPLGHTIITSNLSGKIYAFIKTREYVDSIANFDCSLLPEGSIGTGSAVNVNELTPQTFIISASQHAINTVALTPLQPVDSPGDIRVGETFYVTD